MSDDLIPPLNDNNSIYNLPNTFILIDNIEFENSRYINDLDIYTNFIFNQLNLNDDIIPQVKCFISLL